MPTVAFVTDCLVNGVNVADGLLSLWSPLFVILKQIIDKLHICTVQFVAQILKQRS